MAILFDRFSPANHGDLFTLWWVAGLLLVIGAMIVYNLAQRRYRRYPQLLALHEWVFWPIVIGWALTPLLAVIGVPLLLQLLIVVPCMLVAAHAVFVRFPPRIAAANDEIRRRRYVPPERRDVRERTRPTPAGRRRRHRS